jgi:PAS domain S-box-containing protein
MLVSGYSGIGKSSLVNEIHKPILAQHGYFIAGKFDQLKRNISYDALIQALQELLQQLLTETAATIAVWKSKILAALSTNAQVIIDVIPELEQIIGSQPPVTELGLNESQNRFNRVFKQFINLFCQPEHPLVIFLDDLQWADAASLKLIQLLITDSDIKYLFLIGAYRDNEVNVNHPLMLTVEEMQKSGIYINRIVLQPLQLFHVQQLVSDTFHTNQRKSESLAELLFHKTQGNPFFLTQLLKTLDQDNLISFNFITGCWQWDMELLQDIDITDNVVDLMVNQIQKLSPMTQDILKLAACIGDKFTLDILSIVHQKSWHETAADLWESLQAGLVLPIDESYKIPLVFNHQQNKQLTITYKFLHDRVQQAAYSLITDALQKSTHLQIGRLLLANTTFEERSENIFDLVNHLNYGTELLSLEAEKIQLAELNLIAGKKAKSATAYESAMGYLQVGLSLLTDSSWHQQYELALALHQEAAEAAFLMGDFEQMEQLAVVVLPQAKNELEKVKIYELRIKSYEVQRKLLEAVKLGWQVLEMLGVKVTASPTPLDIQQAVQETSTNLAEKSIEDLINLPSMTDAKQLAAMRLIASLVPAAYQSAPALFILMACQEVNLSIQHGNNVFSASGFADYGVVFSGLLQDVEAAYKFGQLALNLLDNLDASELKSQVLFKVATFLIHWKHHIRETLPLLENAYASGYIGAVDYITKPLQHEEVLARIQLHLQLRHLTQKLQSQNQRLAAEILERTRVEEKLREQAALLDITTDAVLVKDLNDRICFWNKGAENLYGWTAAEAIGQRVRQLLYQPENASQLQNVMNSLADCDSWQGELPQVTRQGKKIIVASRWTLMRDRNGKLQSILTVNTDITEKKQLESQFVRAQRLESVGTLAGGIAHDLNNILTPILTASQLLQLKLPNLDERSQQMLKTIESNSKRGAALVKQVLHFTRGVEGKRTIVQVNYLCSEIQQIVQETFPKSIELSVNIQPNLWTVIGDATNLHQVLMNLVVNARDAMPEGGKLSLSVENLRIDQHYAQMNLDAHVGPYIVISLGDTGMGMEAETLDRIFEPFFTTKDVGKGTGLGLSTVQGIIKSHNGFVKVYSEVGRGTEFKVFLPAVETSAPSLVEDLELLKGNGELVLVVDDEAPILETTRISLEAYNYQVLTARDGIEAIALYAQHQAKISLVLMDMMMPSMDGATTIRALQKMDSHIKIIAVSGFVASNKLVKSTVVKQFIAKPYTTKELLAALHSTLTQEGKLVRVHGV